MMGRDAGEEEYRKLDTKIPQMIAKRRDSKTIIHLVYSKIEDDKTYQLHMLPLINDLKDCNYQVFEHEEFFAHHSDIGACFPKYIIKELSNKMTQII